MPDLGRWFNVDPLAELSPDLSPFRYAFNNPVSVTDPTGMYEDDNYGGGDYYHDSDRGYDFPGSFDFDFHWSNAGGTNSTFDDIINFRWGMDFAIRSGFHDGSGSYGDSMEDIAQEHGSNDMMNDAVQDPYPNQQGPGPRRGSPSPTPINNKGNGQIYPNHHTPLPSPALVMMDSPWDILGILIANSEPKNRYAAYALGAAAIILSKGRAADDVLKGEAKGSLSGTKNALIKVKSEIGLTPSQTLPKAVGKYGSPKRGTPVKGYRLDPAHPNAPAGSPEQFPHINYWDYTLGKKGKGGIKGAIPIKN
ncbi:hypothetical protein [Chryseobacterium suipulveris]|uniref:hypothetical protein n=1 Tax=Chryseobacterium suipulveris TaxID=2929800 RepID=UPI00294FF8B6|nr:hypothetical protein [Chryseobacterium suipulveris]